MIRWLFTALCLLAPNFGKAQSPTSDLELPARWHLTIEFKMSKEAVQAVFGDSVPELHPLAGFALLSVSEDGYVRGQPEPTEIPPGARTMLGLQAAQFLPLVPIPNRDLTNVHRLARSLIVNVPGEPGSALKHPSHGVTVRFGLSAPGGSRTVSFNVEPTRAPFAEVPRTVLTSLNRDLPASYGRILDYLGVPKPQIVESADPAPYGSCDVHRLPLKIASVPILYGLPDFDPVVMQAEESLFPHARRSYEAGCLVGPSSPKQTRMRFCPKCRDAEEQWRFRRDINEQQRHPKREIRRW